VVDDEGDDPHLGAAPRAHQRVDLIDPRDHLPPAPTKAPGIRRTVPLLGGRWRASNRLLRPARLESRGAR
jgi:hypothetical protein